MGLKERLAERGLIDDYLTPPGIVQSDPKAALDDYITKYKSSKSIPEILLELLDETLVSVSDSWAEEHHSSRDMVSSLERRIRALEKRLDGYDKLFEAERRHDDRLRKEIEEIDNEPLNPLDYTPEDWLPTEEEIKSLLDSE